MTTSVQHKIVLKSKLNNVMIHEFESVDAAEEWAEKWRERHGKRAPEAVIARVTITKQEEVISDV